MRLNKYFILVAVLGILLAFVFFRDKKAQPTPESFQPTMPNDVLISLLLDSETEGWTQVTRRQFAMIHQQQGNLAAFKTLLALEENITNDDIPFLREFIIDDIVRQDWQAAQSHMENLLSLLPNDLATHYQLGLIYATEDTELALDHLDKAITENTEKLKQALLQIEAWTPETYRQIGLILLDYQEWPFAERAFTQALELDNQDWQSYAYRGYVRNEYRKDGFSDLETALGLAPTSPLPLYFLGLHWRTIEPNLTASKDAFSNAYFLAPDNPAFAIEVAKAYQLLGDHVQAHNWFNVAVSLDPENVEWERLRVAFFVENNYLLEGDGMETIRAAYGRFPNDAHILASFGYANYLVGRDQDAKSFLELSLSYNANDARTQYYYGLLLQRLGDPQGAIAAFRVATVLDETGYGYLATRALAQLGLQP